MPLVESLQGHGTGWCIAGETTAQHYLSRGDFYIYYSYDQQGKPTIPRSAIHFTDNKISEVRGIAADQNLDPYINNVVDEKLEEFPNKEEYQDMKRLTEIDNRYQKAKNLTKEDLKFLYEVGKPIKGFGWKKDPRIGKILEKRNIKKDLSLVFDCKEDEIGTKKEDFLGGEKELKFFYGHLDLQSITSAEGLKLPESVWGRLDLESLTSAKGLKLPKSVGGDLFLRSLTSAKGLKLPESVGGGIFLDGLTSAEGLKLPESVEGSLDLESLTSAEGLKLPESVGGGIILDGLTSAEGLKLPESVGGDLDLYSLTSAKGLKLPESIGGDIYLRNLKEKDKRKLRKKYPDLYIE